MKSKDSISNPYPFQYKDDKNKDMKKEKRSRPNVQLPLVDFPFPSKLLFTFLTESPRYHIISHHINHLRPLVISLIDIEPGFFK